MLLHRLGVVVESADWEISRLAPVVSNDDAFAPSSAWSPHLDLLLTVGDELFVGFGPRLDHTSSSTFKLLHVETHHLVVVVPIRLQHHHLLLLLLLFPRWQCMLGFFLLLNLNDTATRLLLELLHSHHIL